mgnify:CR=1 FL=1
MKQKVSLLAVCAVLLSLFGAGYLAVVLDPGRKAEEQLTAARKEDVFILSPADARSVLEQFAPELRFVERQTGVSIDELNGKTLAIIQTQAAREQYNDSYRFGELMDTLAESCTEAEYQRLEEIFINCSRYELGFWEMAWTLER